MEGEKRERWYSVDQGNISIASPGYVVAHKTFDLFSSFLKFWLYNLVGFIHKELYFIKVFCLSLKNFRKKCQNNWSFGVLCFLVKLRIFIDFFSFIFLL